ncbi:Endonuclease YncB, thermonuclease family [Andreprevotia lacus DSM 23236]|jgi:endonuclease YncB( thermonuclease family)|uniref:Endonuclease YncB, thermonuclease family n=1 Tax=Andreprevotia lacus DSM 23236 TaxID=1121001 RepID=A0A1W1WZE4_9NEIS|nr:thermonuclease family protein [Andreprevotia lacus]SMC17014.1 Endonuclease YncB, thermonuclease family [Andreprevotia lacus DSM 23236]
MARSPQFGRREAQALQTLFSGRGWPARIAALVVLLAFVWGWYQRENGGLGGHRGGQPGSMSRGQQLQGEVVGVSDGDTVTLLDAKQQQYKLRLAYIDAPEKSQPHGQDAKRALSDLVFRKQVTAEVIDVDRYQRGVAVISVNGQAVNYAQVAAGLAWHYQQYAKGKQSGAEFDRYEAAQQAAQSAGKGLWAERNPTPPWEYRKSQR